MSIGSLKLMNLIEPVEFIEDFEELFENALPL